MYQLGERLYMITLRTWGYVTDIYNVDGIDWITVTVNFGNPELSMDLEIEVTEYDE